MQGEIINQMLTVWLTTRLNTLTSIKFIDAPRLTMYIIAILDMIIFFLAHELYINDMPITSTSWRRNQAA